MTTQSETRTGDGVRRAGGAHRGRGRGTRSDRLARRSIRRRVDQFAQATDDHQWIHVDPERAASGPYGGTIAHGLLTLSLLPHSCTTSIASTTSRWQSTTASTRFGSFSRTGGVAPARRIQDHRRAEVSGGVQATLTTTIEVEGSDKPAAVVESIVRYVA